MIKIIDTSINLVDTDGIRVKLTTITIRNVATNSLRLIMIIE